MKETTREFLALEILILFAVLLSSVFLWALLPQLGISVGIHYVLLLVYLCRWLYWAMRYCESRPHLHTVAGRVIVWIAAMLFLTGVGLAAGGFIQLGARVGIVGTVLAISGVGIGVWASQRLQSGDNAADSKESASSHPHHQDA